MLIHVRDVNDCSLLTFQEEINDTFTEMKFCAPSQNMNWHWVYPFEPDKRHTVHALDAITGKIIFSDTATSLPASAPPVTNVRVTGSNGWIQVAFKAVEEKRRNLIGYKVGYKWLEAKSWTHVESKYVHYEEGAPYVRPVHPCRAFRIDKTFCVLLTDQVRLKDANDHRIYNITIQTFRIAPEREQAVYSASVFATWFNMTACDWTVPGDCPEIGGGARLGGGGLSAPPRDAPLLPYLARKKNAASENPQSSLPNERRKVSESQRYMKYKRGKNLWVTFLGLFLGFGAVGLPLTHLIGLRYGRRKALIRWSRMRASAEKVSIENAARRARRRTLSLPETSSESLSLRASHADANAAGRERRSGNDAEYTMEYERRAQTGFEPAPSRAAGDIPHITGSVPVVSAARFRKRLPALRR